MNVKLCPYYVKFLLKVAKFCFNQFLRIHFELFIKACKDIEAKTSAANW
jgi:hypothetical protein